MRSRPRVLVVHESVDFLRAAQVVLAEAGFEVVPATEAGEARRQVSCGVQAIVLDVAVPDLLPFTWIPELRRNDATASLPIVLVASVYDKTAYKRRPVDLHGADDYVEQHHVPDSLPLKLQALLARRPPPGVRPHEAHAVERRRRQAIAEAAAEREAALREATDPVQAIARVVVADLRLYEGESPSEAARRAAAREIAVRAGGVELEVARRALEELLSGGDR
ncbi:MAG: DNA-binding response regulator [Deltaproteobacteria bacterium]|nr:MAG: DNA-binding response regulator [Deltaproteobacteria bacterium]